MIRTIAVTTAALAVLTLAGCSGAADTRGETAPAATTDSGAVAASAAPQPEQVSFRRIPPSVRHTFFPDTYTGQTNQWRPTVGYYDTGMAVERALPPCDDGSVSLDVDRRVRRFAHTVVGAGDFVVARQLTLYPTAEQARRFAAELRDVPLGCRSYHGRDVTAMNRSDFTRDRFFGVNDKDTRFAEGDLGAGRNAFAYVDVVTVRGNAVMLTRVGRENPGPLGYGVIGDKEKHASFVAQVRRQGRLGVSILDRLA